MATKILKISLEVDTSQGEKFVKVNKLIESSVEKIASTTTSLTAIERQRNEILSKQAGLVANAAASINKINTAVGTSRLSPWFADSAAAAVITSTNSKLRETNAQLREIARNSSFASTLGIAAGTGQRTTNTPDPNPYNSERHQAELLAVRRAREQRLADEIAAYEENTARRVASFRQAISASSNAILANQTRQRLAIEEAQAAQVARNSQSFASRIGSTPIPTDIIATLSRYQRVQAQVAEAQRQSASSATSAANSQRNLNTVITEALPPHRNLFVRIGELVGIYRIWTTAMALAKRAFLDIPAAGIEQQATQASINAIFGSKEGTENLLYIKNLAQEAGQSILILEQAYRTFAPSAALAGASQGQVNQIFSDFTKVSTVLHLTQDKTRAVFLALEQMFAKGVVQSEEIKKQLGNVLPGAVEVAAKAVGKSPAAFMEAMKKNLIIAKDAVPKIAAEYRKIFAGADDAVFTNVADKLQANLGRIRTQYELLDREIFAVAQNGFNFFTRAAADSLKSLSDNLRATLQVASIGVAVLAVKLIDLTAAFVAARIASIGLAASLAAIRTTIIGLVTFTNPYVAALAGIAAGITGISTAALTASGATISYSRFVNASKQQIADLQAAYAAQGSGAQAAGEQLEKLARLQEQSSSYFIEYKGNYLEFSSVISAVWQTIKDLAIRSVKETGAAIEAALIVPIKTWLTDLYNFVSDIFSLIADNIRDMAARMQSTATFIKSLASDAASLNFKGSLDRAVAAQETDAKNRKQLFEKQAQENYQFISDIGTILTDKAKAAGGLLVDDFKLGASTAGDIIGDRAKKIQDAANASKLKAEPTFPGIDQAPIENEVATQIAEKAASGAKAIKDLYKDIIRDSKFLSATIADDLKILSQKYEDHNVSIGTFYERKQAFIEQDLVQQIEANDRLIEIASKAHDTGKLEEFLDREETLLREANAKTRELERAKYKDLKAYNELIQQTQADYLEFIGQTGQANVIKFSLQNKDKAAALGAEYASGNQEAGKQLENLKILQDDAGLRGEINKLEVQRTKITTDYRAELDKTNTLFNTGALGQMGSLLRITELNNLQITQLERLTAQEEAHIRAIQTKGGIVSNSLLTSLDAHKREIESLKLTANAVAEHFKSTMGQAFDDAFVGLVTGSMTGKQAFISFATSIQQEIAKIIASEIRLQAIKGIVSLIGNVVGAYAGSGASSSGVSSLTGGAASGAYINGVAMNAQGGVYSGAGISAYSGKVVSSPTVFPFAKGIGLMGEQGAEGILPLKRNSQGKLGVSAELSSSGGVTIENMNIQVVQKDDATTQEQAAAIGKAVRDQVKSLITSEIKNSIRPGGQLNPTQMAANF